MIKIKNTPHLLGITVSGDYDDLHSLYEALSRYPEFFQKNNPDSYPYEKYEYLLSLNYDIRHAMQGDRQILCEEHYLSSLLGVSSWDDLDDEDEEEKKKAAKLRRKYGEGNLYYSVEFLYPLVFYYLSTLEHIVRYPCLNRWFDQPDNEFPYSRLTAGYDRAQILLFVEGLWQNLADLLGEDVVTAMRNFVGNESIDTIVSTLYDEYLLWLHMVEAPKLDEEQNKALLTVLAFRLLNIPPEKLYKTVEKKRILREYYDRANALIKSVLGQRIRTFPMLMRAWDKYFDGRQQVSHDEYEEFLDHLCGEPDWYREL